MLGVEGREGAKGLGVAAKADASRVARTQVGRVERGPLYYAQVREDPALEIEALRPSARAHVVVVASGGCTALSLLAAGAKRVSAVDRNPTQNDLVELKALAVARLGARVARAFLGASAAPAGERAKHYRALRELLSASARAHYDGNARAIEKGVLASGVTERFVELVAAAIKVGVHPTSRIERMLACRSLEEQRELYRREWDTRRWRALFHLLLNRVVFRKAYDPAFFEHVENPSYVRHFLGTLEVAFTSLPVRENYFLRHMLLGDYPSDTQAGLPPYLTDDGARAIGRDLARLELVDGDITRFLAGCPAGSVDAFALSNVAEWMTPAEIDELFAAVARAAAPGARVCVRNFLGWTDLPSRWRERFVEDQAAPAKIREDRSGVQRRFAVFEYRGDVV